jgi:hypothetical protein
LVLVLKPKDPREDDYITALMWAAIAMLAAIGAFVAAAIFVRAFLY